MLNVTLFAAFLAGVVSFLAPCVVPLFPIFVSFITGVSVTELENSQNAPTYRARILSNTLLYIFGFCLMFTLLGLGATSLGKSLIQNRFELNRVSGAFMIFFGFYTLGLFNSLNFSHKQFRLNLPSRLLAMKYLGPFLMGVAFALAWSPCTGAILGAILTLAANATSVGQGGLLLFAYSLGISLPFLLTALTVSRSFKFIQKLDGKLRFLNLACGILLVLFGLLMLLQKFDFFSGLFLSRIYDIPGYMNLVNSL